MWPYQENCPRLLMQCWNLSRLSPEPSLVPSWQLNFSARFSCECGVIYMIVCTVPRPQSLSSLHCAECRRSPNNQTVLALLSFQSAKWHPYSSAWCRGSRKSTLAGEERAETAGVVLSSPFHGGTKHITTAGSFLFTPCSCCQIPLAAVPSDNQTFPSPSPWTSLFTEADY